MMTITIDKIGNYTQAEVFKYLIKLDDPYFNGESIISDSEYDEIRKYAKAIWPNSSYFTQTGSKVRGVEVQHVRPVGGLKQLYVGEVNSWISKYPKASYIVSEKLDGASATLSYVGNKLKIALSKGDGILGKDFTRHVLQIPSVPKTLISSNSVLDVRGEIIIRKKDEQAVKDLLYKLTKREYKNLRNIVNGLLNASEVPEEVLQYFDFVAYGIIDSKGSQSEVLSDLSADGFIIPEYHILDNVSEEGLTDLLSFMRADSVYEIDGLVVDINESDKRSDLGFNSDYEPNYAFKWKVSADDNHAFSKCVGIDWKVSKHNLLKPTVLIEPVDLVGVTIARLSGFNARFIQENGIGPGSIIEFTRSGDVIPHILGVSNKQEPSFPTIDWKWNDAHVEAVVMEETDEAEILKIKSFFNALEIDQLQEASVKALYANGFDTIQNIIYMDDLDWNRVIGANGLKSYACLLKRFNHLHLYELMGAWPYFGIGFGITRAKILYDALGDKVLTATREEIISVEGFGDKMTDLFLEGRDRFINFYADMLKYGLIEFAESEEEIQGNLTGASFAFTGFRDKVAESRIEAEGGIIHDGVKKGTTYLVVKDISKKTAKLEKAEKQGIKIIDINGLNILLGN